MRLSSIVYTSDAWIKKFKVEELEDPERVFPPYDAILLVSPAAAQRPKLRQTLEQMLGKIDQETIMKANGLVDLEHKSFRFAAEWIRKGERP